MFGLFVGGTGSSNSIYRLRSFADAFVDTVLWYNRASRIDHKVTLAIRLSIFYLTLVVYWSVGVACTLPFTLFGNCHLEGVAPGLISAGTTCRGQMFLHIP